MKICTSCGTTNAEGVKMCKNCGSPLKTVNVAVRTTHRRKRIKKSKTEISNITTSNDFNPVQHLNTNFPKQNSNVQSISPETSKLEYKFHSPGQQKAPLESIPPTPVDELIIPQPIRSRRKRKKSTPPSIIDKQSASIELSDNTITDDDLTAIPSQNINQPLPQVQPVSVPPANQVPRKEASHPTNTPNHPIMSFSSQSLQSQQIEQEMATVMSSLKGTSTRKNLVESEPEQETSMDFTIPDSLDEILVKLTQLDVNIEASALVNLDGKILASAISERIDEFLLSTITNTLGTISQDVIASLESGDLKFISLYATKGILFLSPIMKNVFLVLYTSSDAKMGLINLARMLVKKKIELYYAKQNLQKTPV